mgnify:CR=1 FL=1
MRNLRNVSTSLLVLLLGACTYDASYTDPIRRSFTWFTYVSGEDIRNSCSVSSPDQLRFVYNGIYQHQVRSYDVSYASHTIKTNVRSGGLLNDLKVDDLLAPWRGETTVLEVSDQELNLLKKSVIADGVKDKPNVGLRLYSDQFYWTVAACIDGEYHFNGYKWGNEEFDKLTFDDVLRTLDVSDVAFNEPKKLTKQEIWDTVSEADPFLIQVDESGIVGF